MALEILIKLDPNNISKERKFFLKKECFIIHLNFKKVDL